ncbi:hypothetical protein ACKWRH_03655 [Bradyrhizobium sp. Pa8]|uniref:hypothetical protein n=1 Tax=Bradyrhizobium sp. Pa8 TaxID=3386552 RepID=UPI00403F9771
MSIHKLKTSDGASKSAGQLVNLDTEPFVPDRWAVMKGAHQKGGLFNWDPTKVGLYLSKKQQKGRCASGYALYKELGQRSRFNANLLDYLHQNSHLIPCKWKNKYIFFWGTLYHNHNGDPCVRYLYWYREAWRWDYAPLYVLWRDHCPAAVPTTVGRV